MAIAFLRQAIDRARNKYGARAQTIDGEWFSSSREARRWSELRLLQRAGEITGLQRQQPFMLTVLNTKGEMFTIGRYVADFTYFRIDPLAHVWVRPLVVEDTKGVRTELYRWKKRHFEAQYGLSIDEV